MACIRGWLVFPIFLKKVQYSQVACIRGMASNMKNTVPHGAWAVCVYRSEALQKRSGRHASGGQEGERWMLGRIVEDLKSASHHTGMRVYFTKESHLVTLLNLLLCAEVDSRNPQSLGVFEMDYLLHITLSCSSSESMRRLNKRFELE